MRVEPAENVCQLRIDLLDFSLAPPNGDGTCNTDVISVTGSATNVPALCGENAAQHIIADFAGTNPITIAIKATSSYTFGRHWNIRVAQINCDSAYKGKSVRLCLGFCKRTIHFSTQTQMQTFHVSKKAKKNESNDLI